MRNSLGVLMGRYMKTITAIAVMERVVLARFSRVCGRRDEFLMGSLTY